jgi:flagellar motor switch protein FliM
MAPGDPLSQADIDARLEAVAEDAPARQTGASPMRPFDPTAHSRIVRERLHGLDGINQRFARRFRVSLFNLMRHSADITVQNLEYQTYQDFVRNVAVPTNINVITMKPLRGAALVVLPPDLVFMVVDNLFGGDGRFPTPSTGREFTNTEQRIIHRVLDLMLDAYQQCWQPVYPLEAAYARSEIHAKFANITNSPNDLIINTTFHIDVGGLGSSFQICIPYSMIEPLRDLLTNPSAGAQDSTDEAWTDRIAGKIRASEVELVAEFVQVAARIGQVQALQAGDVLPIDLPGSVTATVNGVPVLRCEYGSHNGQRALRVLETVNHADPDDAPTDAFARRPAAREIQP